MIPQQLGDAFTITEAAAVLEIIRHRRERESDPNIAVNIEARLVNRFIGYLDFDPKKFLRRDFVDMARRVQERMRSRGK